MNPAPKLFSPLRTWDIAVGTFQQLVRMKVFYFLIAFGLLLIVANFVEDPFSEGPQADETYVLSKIKSWSLGGMALFSTIFAIVGTALLLPRDVEDRTLYTILAKPVPRLDYLAGKLLGVVMLIGVSLVAMDLLMIVMLEYRTGKEVEAVAAQGFELGATQAEIDAAVREVEKFSPNWMLQAGVLAIFLKSVVLAAFALLLSTFATSTLFTVIMATLVFFIGHFQADVRDFMLRDSDGGISMYDRIWTGVISLLVPDFKLFNVIDASIDGLKITGALMLKLTGITALYSAIYLVVSWFIFADKEL